VFRIRARRVITAVSVASWLVGPMTPATAQQPQLGPGTASFAFVGKMHLGKAYCYPLAFCAPGPTTFTLMAGTKNPDPNGGFSDCVGVDLPSPTAVWGPICELAVTGSFAGGPVFPAQGPHCLDSSATATGFVRFYLQQELKDRVNLSGGWSASIGDTWLFTGTASRGTGSGPIAIAMAAAPDIVFKNDSCTTGADDFRVSGVATASWT